MGSFQDSGIPLPPVSSGTGTWGDYDGDGNLDILLLGPTGPAHLLHNNHPVTNQPPSAPQALASVVVENSVTLKWDPASDPNQRGGFSYNVRIGNAPGLGNIVNPQADPVTGKRYLPQLGNAFESLSLTVTNLPVGTHYWAVQAIDASFAGSPFPVESTFTVAPRAPGAITLPATNITSDSAWLEGLANPNGLDTSVYFQYGLSTNYGSITSAKVIPAGASPVPIQTPLAALRICLTYSFRFVASNSLGITYGTNQTFRIPQFAEVDSGLPPVEFGQGAWADWAQRGVMDVFISGQVGYFMTLKYVNSLFQNSGEGEFTELGLSFPACTNYPWEDFPVDCTMAWGDFDNTGAWTCWSAAGRGVRFIAMTEAMDLLK